MKKFILFSMMLLAFAVTTSCEKEETPEPQQQTLEQLYPDWKNLTWLETYRNSDNVKVQYPQMSITIDSNLVTIVTTLSSTNVITNTYSKIAITGNDRNYIEFRNNEPPTDVYKFEKNNNNNTITLDNGSPYLYRYILKIN